MINFFRLCIVMMMAGIISCNGNGASTADNTPAAETAKGGQENVNDNESEKDVVKIAVSSKDHSTLVSALKQAGPGYIAFQCRTLYRFCANQCSF
jgi:uncharacterized surface protein with fasciclin (FAS1) repeats